MKSSTGRTTLLARLLRAAQMPTGIPMATANTVATRTSASVCMASTHRPIAWMSRKASSVNSPNPHLRSSSASTTNTNVTTIALGAVRTNSTASSRNSMIAEMAWKSGPKCAVSQSTSAPTGAPSSILGIGLALLRVFLLLHRGGGQRGQQRRARHDAQQPPRAVGDAQRHAVVPDERTRLAQRRVHVHGPVLLGRQLSQRRAVLPDG